MLNDVSRPDIGFNSDRNEVTIVTASDAFAFRKPASRMSRRKFLRPHCGSGNQRQLRKKFLPAKQQRRSGGAQVVD